MTPAAETRKPRRTVARPAPSSFMAEDSLIDSTGSTQGMTFRINPPRKAVRAIQTMLESGAVARASV